MYKKIETNLYELLRCLSSAQDLVSPLLLNHHQQVAYLSFRLAEQAKLSIDQQKNTFLAALVHDIGALSVDEKLELIEQEPVSLNNHAFKGAKLLEGFKPLQDETNIIKFHHIPWDYGKGRNYKGEMVPYESHIIHLADRVCAMLGSNQHVLSQLPQVLKLISEKTNELFEPGLVELLVELSKKEYIWLDLVSRNPINKINIKLFDIISLGMDDLIDFAALFSQIIDFKSSFTARHSAGVAKTAERIAQLMGFSPLECKMMLVAGYLHDLGKLAISNTILEKEASLTEDEFNEIRTHTYYTYQMLDTIPQLNTIKIWASYHHERIDGKGYPFHIKGDKLTLGSRVLAVADVFTAIKEDRPYRQGMDDAHAVQILDNMVEVGALDREVVEVLKNHLQPINELRQNTQQEASIRYENFLQIN